MSITVARAIARFRAHPNVQPQTVADSAANILTKLDGLQMLYEAGKLRRVQIQGSSTLALSANQLSHDSGSLRKIVGSFSLTPTGTVHAATAAGIPKTLLAKLTTGLAVSDTAAHVSAFIAKLEFLAEATRLRSISLTDDAPIWLNYERFVGIPSVLALLPNNYHLVVRHVSAAGADAVEANAHVTSFVAYDSSVHVADALDALNADGNLSGINLSDSIPMAINYTQFQFDKGALEEIRSVYHLAVSGATAAVSGVLGADRQVSSFTVVDNSTNVAQSLKLLSGASNLSSISLSDAAPISITYKQYIAGGVALGKISGSYDLVVNGAPVAAAADLQADVRVRAFSITDNSANVIASIDALNTDDKISVLSLTDNTQRSVSYQQLISDAAALERLPNEYRLTVSGLPAGESGMIASAYNGSLYAVVAVSPSQITWTDARAASVAMGGDLASIASSDVNTFIYNLTLAEPMSWPTGYYSDRGPWLGGFQLAGSANGTGWEWVDGTAWSFSDWTQGEPSGNGDRYLHYKPVNNPAEWNDVPDLASVQGFVVQFSSASPKGLAVIPALSYIAGHPSAPPIEIIDTATNINYCLNSLLTVVGDIKSIKLTDIGTPLLSISYTQYSNDISVLEKIAGSYGLVVTGAPVSSAVDLQADTHVTTFSVSDTAAAIQAGLPALNFDSKLSLMTLSGSSGADTLNLTGNSTASSINLAEDGASAAVIIDGEWSIVDLGTTVQSSDINNFGQIVGWESRPSGAHHAVTILNGRTIDLGTLGGTSSQAYAISDTGVIIGSAQTSSGVWDAFVWKDGVMSDLGTPYGAGSIAEAIAADGTVYGISNATPTDSTTLPYGYPGTLVKWNAQGVATNLGTLGGASLYSVTLGGGLLGGTVFFGSSPWVQTGTYRGFIYDTATLTASIIGNYDSSTYGINDYGVAVGYENGGRSGADVSGWLYTAAGGLQVQPGPNGNWDILRGINNQGNMIGLSARTQTVFYGNGTNYNVTIAMSGLVNGLSSFSLNDFDQFLTAGGGALAGHSIVVSPKTLGLDAPAVSFIGTPDKVTLGSGASTINYVLQQSSGVEAIANFQYGLDTLCIDLLGAAAEALQVRDTSYNGQAAISLYSGADPTHGVVLTGVPSSMTAADLLTNHLTFSGGHATVT